MRVALALTLPALILLGACATASKPPPPPSMRVVTTDEANRGGVKGAAAAPLRDVNLLRTKIPQVLLDALNDPYERPRPMTCASLAAAIQPLTDALGADIDEPSSSDDRDLIVKGRDAAEDTAFGMMASAAQDLIPMRSWVRRLTGAEQHDRLVRAAITAGGIRRGYLKGLGEMKNCPPPAMPSHIKSTLPPPEEKKKGPKYPIR
ncbi:hypothetical protein QO010_001722 [Caulobacter ginsengisoli]|uniref:Uncharacterized protein n=1 Tax=Caulobacter ginsengisoli TaxID=400775 RepID=A0ABU0IRH0_9CAUL|nr:hypothetical protein [Caulobacter ginsengisoli]MDQ0463951.1 hypothetical protein [Caulobacter ginsengisoli]